MTAAARYERHITLDDDVAVAIKTLAKLERRSVNAQIGVLLAEALAVRGASEWLGK